MNRSFFPKSFTDRERRVLPQSEAPPDLLFIIGKGVFRRLPRREKRTKGDLRNNFGFTLLELMISLSILGIMIFILMGILRLGFRSVEAGEKKINSLERVRASLNIIESQIQSAIPLTHEADGETKFYFKGDRTSLEISTNYSIWEGEIGYSAVSYRVTEAGGGKWSLWASESHVGQGIKREIKLLDGLDDLYFEYYYKDPTEEEGKWVDLWDQDNLIPEKIRLTMNMGGKAVALIIPMKTGWTLVTPGLEKKS